MDNYPISSEPVSNDNIGVVSFSGPAIDVPATEPINSCGSVEPLVPAVPAPPPTKIITAYINPNLSKMVSSAIDGDDILIEIGLDVSVNDTSDPSTFKSGTVLKTLKLSKSKLEADLLSQSSKPVTTVESKKEGKKDAQRLRELAGIPGKGNWV